jgi:predicted Zn-dependent protease
MNMAFSAQSTKKLESNFSLFCDAFFNALQAGEHARISLEAEQTHFLRMSRGAVRQNGIVHDAQVAVVFMLSSGQTWVKSFPFVENTPAECSELAKRVLATCRERIAGVPADPFAHFPKEKITSHTEFQGEILQPGVAVEALLGKRRAEEDLVGIYAGGTTVSALADSAGSRHWFSGESFFVDYSLWLANGRAVKSSYAGRHWKQDEYEFSLQKAARDLAVLKRPQRTLKPGNYRVFLAPSATSELINMFSWGALSESALQRKESPLCAVRAGEKSFSPHFSLRENYGLGFAPRFSDDGELAAESIALFESGRFVQALVSARTQKEFGVTSNGSGSERLRTPEMGTGTLALKDAFKELGTGLYLSDLHYLNWSDMIQGRITGMTRYGCLWVENGEAVGPIQDMRFDETLFRCFGSELSAVTQEAEVIPETSTYGRRALGGAKIPGVLLNSFQFTL